VADANQSSQRGAASATNCQRALTWVQRLKRVFAIDIETCRQCGGRLNRRRQVAIRQGSSSPA